MIKRLLNFYKRRFWTTQDYGRSIGVQIGQNCSLGKIDFGTEPYLIEIGDNVQITDDVKFFTHGGGWIFREKYPDFDVFGKIKISDNVYIGNNVLIMPGVTISSNVIVGAGAVVTKSVAENCIIGGNPARVIGNVKDLEARLLPYNVKTKGMDHKVKKEFLLKLSCDKFLER